MTDMNNATREVFGNIAPWMRVVFFIMIGASIAVLVWQIAARVWLWRKGQKGGFLRDWWLLGLLLSLAVTGFMVEALRIHYTQVQPDVAHWSIVGWLIDVTLLRDIDVGSAQTMHLAAWWLHAILVALFFATIPVNRFLHVITGPMN